MKHLKRRILSLGMVFVLAVTTLLSGIGTLTVHAATETMVVISPWAYGNGVMDNTQTYSAGGYEYATVIAGSSNTYTGARMKDADLSLYSTVRFAVKSDGSAWYEIGKVASNSYDTTADCSADWKEIKLVDEGNGYFQMFIGGSWVNQNLPLDTNLADLQMKFGISGTLVMTEVRGILRDGAASPLIPIRNCISSGTGTDVSETVEKPIPEATKIMQIGTTWSWNPMLSVNLEKYTKLKFYARNTADGDAYLEIRVGTNAEAPNSVVYKSWTEVLFTKNVDKTWNVYLAGKLKLESVSISNLNELQMNFGTNNYYLSQVFGVKDSTSQPSDAMVIVSPWAFGNGVMDNTQSYYEGDYEYATVITGSSNTYTGARMKDADLSLYSTVRFAVKSDGSAWYEIGKVADNTYNVVQNNSAEWTEVKLVDEGNSCFQMYVNGTQKSYQFPLDTNLSDLQMKFGTSGTLIMTEVRGTLRDGAASSLLVLKDCIRDEEGTDVSDTVEKPIPEATKITQMGTTWAYNQLPDVTLKKYNKLKFYARNTTDGVAYLEMRVGDDEDTYKNTEVFKSWTEILFTKNEDKTWNVYLAGTMKLENINISNLNELKMNFGDYQYYLSQLFAIEEAGPSDAMVVVSPWAFGNGVMDNEQTYADGDYEYATVISGSDNTYAGARMKDADLSLYSTVRFAVKSDGSAWYEIGKVASNSYDTTADCSADWKEIKLVDEGNGYFQMYIGGSWVDQNLPLDTNLSDLQMKFGASGTLVMTEVRGTLRDGAISSLTVLKDCIKDGEGTSVDVEKPIYEATKITQMGTSWAWNSMPDVELRPYNKLKFYVRNTADSDAYLEMRVGDDEDTYKNTAVFKSWTEVLFNRNDTQTWNVYLAGKLGLENISIANLNELKMNLGDSNYYLSQLFAVEREMPKGDVNQDYETNSCDLVHEKKAIGGTYNELYDLNGDGFVDNTDVKKLRYILLDVAEGDMVLNVENTVLLNAANQAQYQLDYNSEDAFAAQEFATFMQESTGADYAASTADKKIVIGKAKASAANMSFAGLTTDNGYAIRTKGNDIYVYGNTTQGTLNGVYELLNRAIDLEIYAGDCYTYSHTAGTAITLNFTDENAVFNPEIDYLYDLNGETRANSTYQKRLSYVTDYVVLGGNAHAESNFITSAYYTGTLSNGHMVLDAQTAKEAAQWLYETGITVNTNKEKFLFGLADNTVWYDNDVIAGQASTDQYVTFMNQMAAELSTLLTDAGSDRTITLVLMAYNNTIMAPSVDIVPQSNVKMDVMYAPAQANWYKPMSDAMNDLVPVRNADNTMDLFTYDADGEFQKWADKVHSVNGDVMLWSYHTFFDSYLTPLDCIDSMYANYKLASDMGAVGVLDNVQYNNDVATDWNRLKVYLRSELAKNPSMSETEYQTLIDNFMNAYFGTAATTMKSVLEKERSIIKTLFDEKQDSGIFSQNYGCGKAAVMVTSKGNYKKWGLTQSGLVNITYSGSLKTDVYEQMQAAYDAVEGETYKKRIKLEMLAIRYVLLSTLERTDSSNSDTFAQLASDCTSLGLTMVSEGNAVSEANLKIMANWN